MIRTTPYTARRTRKTVCVFDTETDPFAKQTRVKPFTCGFYDGSSYWDFWGDDCVEQFFAYLTEFRSDEELLIYVHNGGGFDFHFQYKFLNIDMPMDVRDGKIVKAFYGNQEFRDSLKILPFALDTYQKTKIDYDKFKRDVREQHRREIRLYQRSDCLNLYDLVSTFQDEFGDKKTVASAAFAKLRSIHGIEELTEKQDTLLRPYYHGGRVECFRRGIHRRSFSVFDVNSMYPSVMRNYLHPIGNRWWREREITKDTAFVKWRGINRGGACRIDKGLNFNHGYGEFDTTIHEYNAGILTGTIEVEYVVQTWNCDQWGTFAEFVDRFYAARIAFGEAGDEVRKLLYKYILNSSYGKLGQDPRRFMDTTWTYGEVPEGGMFHPAENPNGWHLHIGSRTDGLDFMTWNKPAIRPRRKFYNVGTAASITGAARAELLLGIAASVNPLYCDTDSLICDSLDMEQDAKRLGAWKLEATGELIAIAGKKDYACFSVDCPTDPHHFWFKDPEKETIWDDVYGKMYCIKKATKGFRATGSEIYRVADGEVLIWENEVPSFKLNGSVDFIKRRIRMTA